MNFDQVILVDAGDQVIGRMDKLPAHQQGRLHRAFSIVIYRQSDAEEGTDGNGVEVLMHRRADEKYHCPGLWTNTCCSHPQPDIDIGQSALTRLSQEMGMTADLHPIGDFTYRAEFDNGLIEHEIDHVFIGAYNNGPIRPNPLEVSAIEWMDLNELFDDISNHPSRYTPWVEQVLEMTEKHLMST